MNCLQGPECFAIAGQKESGKKALALTPKSNIERFAEEIVTIIKAVKEDRRILCEISE